MRHSDRAAMLRRTQCFGPLAPLSTEDYRGGLDQQRVPLIVHNNQIGLAMIVSINPFVGETVLS